MRVLMLGWDFSPRLSGGVGTACQGLAGALARGPEATEVLFVLPRVHGDEEPEKVRLLSGTEEAPLPPLPALPRTVPAEPSLEPAPPAPEPAAGVPAPPVLPAAVEALRLLAIDSPLRPYYSARDYTEAVRGLLERIRAAAPGQASAGAAPFRELRLPARKAARPPPAQRAAPSERARAAVQALAATRITDPGTLPYGISLGAEVERYARMALALTQAEPFDVIHAHDWMTFPAALLLRERSGKPLVVHFHSSEPERRGPLAAPEVRAIEQAALEASDRVLCVSEASARTLRNHYSVERAKLRVLHNAYSPLPAAERELHAGPVVLYLGRLSEQKGPDVFLRAAARVARRHPKAQFVLAGEGELYPELADLAGELEIADKVRFTGFVSGAELARTYAQADAYVLSSRAEPFGISALEALSLGVPTIVPRGSGVSEVANSLLRFAPGDVADLAEKIVGLLERPALRSLLSASGLREVKKLRWDRPARALRGIYEEVVRASPTYS